MIKISIVVAAYNVENYIDRCIISLLNQTYKEIEIILVNDCSTDNTLSVINGYASNDARIKVVDKTNNEGLSEARNSGINVAIGDYITFVDGDDFLEKNTIETCVDKILCTSADEIVFGSSFDRNNGYSYKMEITSSKKYYSGNQDMNIYFDEAIGALPSCKNDRNIGITPWGRVYRKSILDENCLRFISERMYIYEDLTFFLLSANYINSVFVLNEPLYHYCENQGSLTQKCDLKRFDKVKRMYFYIKDSYYEKIFANAESLLRFKRQMLSYIRLSIIQLSNSCQNIQLIKKICMDSFTKEVLESYPINELPIKQRIFTKFLYKEKAFLLYILCRCNR